MFFDFGRSEGFPTQYAAHLTPVTVDILEVGFIAAFLILFVCFLVFVPSNNSSDSWSSILRIFFTLLIGLLIFLGNFGQEWEVGHINTKTPYRTGIGGEINGSIGIKIGLRSVNVTLKSSPEQSGLPAETINYNERFSWEWDQGRFGFGPYAGKIQREFREAQYRGVPIPILWIVDYFVIDGEGFRHGRFYRTAGWYCHIAMWTAFPCWLLSIVLLRSVIKYGAYFLAITGGLLWTANFLWLVIRNPNPLVIPFEDDVITTKFGVSYWLTFITGFICLTLSGIILFMHFKYVDALYIFFGVDPLNSYDETYLTKEEEKLMRKKPKTTNELELEPMPTQGTSDEYVHSDRYLMKRSSRHRSILPKKKTLKMEKKPIFEDWQEDDNEYASFA